MSTTSSMSLRLTITRMRRSATLGALLVLAPVFPRATAPLNAQPPRQQAVAWGWYAAGSTLTREYTVGLEPLRRPGGTGFVGATIKGLVEAPAASGLLLQSVRADAYRGRRVRLTAWLRTAGDPDAEARLWMRVDGARGTEASDYMLDRPITGTREWAEYAVVLDIPSDAAGISFGVAYTGRGQVWADDLAFETVGGDVANTGVALNGSPSHSGNGNGDGAPARRVEVGELGRTDIQAYRFAPTRPVNLDFEQPAVIASR